MIIPIKKIILEMSTALKRRQNFKQAGIIPTKHDPNNTFPQKFIHRNIVDNKGNLLPKKELNDILQNLGKVPNNAYQGAKIANKNYGNSKEILRSFDHSGDSGWIGGEKDRAIFRTDQLEEVIQFIHIQKEVFQITLKIYIQIIVLHICLVVMLINPQRRKLI